jgi:hypothetical protein
MKSINERDLDEFLGNEEESDKKKIKQDTSLIERIDKKVITEDGRQLLI